MNPVIGDSTMPKTAAITAVPTKISRRYWRVSMPTIRAPTEFSPLASSALPPRVNLM